MKNIIIFGVFFILLGGIGLVMAGSQTVTINGAEIQSFTIENLEFGTVTPGDTAIATSNVTLHESNNVDLDMDIYLEDGSNSLFDLIVLNLTELNGGETENLGIGIGNAITLTVLDDDVNDSATEQVKNMTATLAVPIGISPGERSATITYHVSGTTPQ